MTGPPAGLAKGGRALWSAVLDSHELDTPRLAVLEQACRQRDRCDTLAANAANGDPGALRHESDSAMAMPRLPATAATGAPGALPHERDSAMAMTRLLSALRLPDDVGRQPQARQIRGV